MYLDPNIYDVSGVGSTPVLRLVSLLIDTVNINIDFLSF
jgi:hypothetical protein